MILLQAKIAIQAAGDLLSTSKEQGFLIYILVCMLVFFAVVAILVAWLYIQKQNKIVAMLEKQIDTKKLLEELATAKIRQINETTSDQDLKRLMVEFLLKQREITKS